MVLLSFNSCFIVFIVLVTGYYVIVKRPKGHHAIYRSLCRTKRECKPPPKHSYTMEKTLSPSVDNLYAQLSYRRLNFCKAGN